MIRFWSGEGRQIAVVACLVMLSVLVMPMRPATGKPEASSTRKACAALDRMIGGTQDAGPVLQSCVDATPSNGKVALLPGRYLIATPVAVRHPVTLTTRNVSSDAPPCSREVRRCATLHLAISDAAVATATMPFDIASNDVRLDHLVFEGTRLTDPRLSTERCASKTERPMGGGMRINGNMVTVRKSMFRDMACYTALEYGIGVDATIIDNDFIGNGIHSMNLRWADGLTIHTATRFHITGNRFRDNTDVQLILGSCIDCTITSNAFHHGGAAAGGAFAELMLQAWPKATSGDFSGTQVAHNIIDCGPMRRCGFGIMIGSAPWYDAPVFGGSLIENEVRGAMLPLDIDYLTGPMTIARNRLVATSGVYPSSCGPQSIHGVAANISPKSRTFLSHVALSGVTMSTHYCILNYAIASSH